MPRIVRAALIALALPVALALAPAAAAAPSPSCDKPPKPKQFKSQAEKDEFIASAQAYMDCLKAFYEEQSAVSKEHAQAANAARAEMQRYAEEVKK